MIVLLTCSSRAQECAEAIEARTHQQTVIANSLASAAECVKRPDAEALVVDASFQQVENGIDTLLTKTAVIAVPIYVNLSLHGAERVAVEVSCGLQRISQERAFCMRAATSEVRHQLRGEVTAILLNSELALRDRELPSGAAEKLKVVCEMAERIRHRLDGSLSEPKAAPLKPRLVERPASPRAAR